MECRGVSHWFGSKRVLFDLNLKVLQGQFLSLVGPSGCGKSTLLRAIVGTHLPLRGEIVLFTGPDGGTAQVVRGPGRDRGIVYQHYSLFPFLNAQQNVAIGLMLDETTIPFRWLRFPAWRRMRREHLDLAAEFLRKVKLQDAMQLYPHEMSGGMRQRVAIAQALIMKPKIILLDEPFGALDEATREELQTMLLELYHENQQAKTRDESPPYTLLIVTHELNEAIYVGDRLVGFSQNWDWRSEGHTEFPGATVVYDKPSPVFGPNETKDVQQFADQRDEIRRIVFSPATVMNRTQHITYGTETSRPA
jgi:NitT/TauT family transport system ATP-binding protein